MKNNLNALYTVDNKLLTFNQSLEFLLLDRLELLDQLLEASTCEKETRSLNLQRDAICNHIAIFENKTKEIKTPEGCFTCLMI